MFSIYLLKWIENFSDKVVNEKKLVFIEYLWFYEYILCLIWCLVFNLVNKDNLLL